MILYFSGTGNSKYVAKRIAEITGDNIVSLNAKIKNGDRSGIVCGAEGIVFVTPTYAWRIPRLVEKYIKQTEFKSENGRINARFVLTCGGEIANAGAYNKKLCDFKGFNYMGTSQILMPENYVAMFRVPENDEAKKIVEKAEPLIESAAQAIKNGNALTPPANNLLYSFLSGPVNPLFYKFTVKTKKFFAGDKCVSCGKCAEVCPLNNVFIKNGKPCWGKNCTHCMACICYCPAKAIEYGKNSANKPRYNFENLKK